MHQWVREKPHVNLSTREQWLRESAAWPPLPIGRQYELATIADRPPA
jgi:hypothetical protein